MPFALCGPPLPSLPPTRATGATGIGPELRDRPFRATSAIAVVLATGAVLASGTALAAQRFDAPLTPRGHLEIQAAPVFTSFDSRFGFRHVSGAVVEDEEELAFDFNDDQVGARMLPVLGPFEAALQDALGDPSFRLSLGRSRAVMQAHEVRIPVRIALGVLDRLTVGATVPFVQRRVETRFLFRSDDRAANSGFSPAVSDPGAVTGFLGQFASALSLTRAQVESACATSGESSEACLGGRALVDEADGLFSSLQGAYLGSVVFPAAGTEAGEALVSRVQSVQQSMAGYGVPFGGSPPLSEGLLGEEDFQNLLSDPAYQISGLPVGNWESLWELGDTEAFAALRFLDVQARDSAGTARFGYRGVAGVVYRIGTGTVDAPENFTDLGSGDGQPDLELQLFNDLTLGRHLGLTVDLRYGIQQEGEVVRRIAAPDAVFPELATQTLLTWDPGDYRELTASPRLRLTDGMAFATRYRYLTREADRYDYAASDVVDPNPGAPSPSLLDEETEATLHELGFGVIFTTLPAVRAGRTSLPFEAHARYDHPFAGSGGRTPKAGRVTFGLRMFFRLWGSGP